MANELQCEVKFTSVDIQELIGSGAVNIVVSCKYTREPETGEWSTIIAADGFDAKNVLVASKTGCPMPC